jgi:hypothetical protein
MSRLIDRCFAVAAVLLVSLLAAGAAAGSAGASSSRGTTAGCPRGALVLPADAVARAGKRAVAEAAKRYRGLKTAGARVVDARRADAAGPRGREVLRHCGPTVRHRTVVVQLLFPRMLPSASLSEGVVDVSLFPGGYRVWEVVH